MPIPPPYPVDPQPVRPLAQPGPALLEEYFPHPPALGSGRMWLGAAGLSGLGALTFPGSAPGAQIAVFSSALFACAVIQHRITRGPGAQRDPIRMALAGLALALPWVSILRDSPSTYLALWGAFGLLAWACVDARTWRQSLWAPPALIQAMIRSPRWLRGTVGALGRPQRLGPALTGSALALVIGLPVLLLLTAADASFAEVIGDLRLIPSGPELIARFSAFIALMFVISAILLLISGPIPWPQPRPKRPRPLLEWAL
ncbi:MAG: DUF4153 domain-containing protein, partial [Angustibacter sp.]